MPKNIELTIEIGIQKVSCPGVWLCQDGYVSLTIYALGTTYQTCLLPPVFPLTFRDVFYFRKVFNESCSVNNMCCLLKDETIYCELVQWCEDCTTSECVMLAQYLGALNDVLFPPNVCSTDGVDLLMRRTSDFPGILSPKIEIATKVRIDEVWGQSGNTVNTAEHKVCHCNQSRDNESGRRNQVCHSAQYHRLKCNKPRPRKNVSRSRSRSRSEGSKSYCSLGKEETPCRCPNPFSRQRKPISNCPTSSMRRSHPCREYNVYAVNTGPQWCVGQRNGNNDEEIRSEERTAPNSCPKGENCQKVLLESQYIEHDQHRHETPSNKSLFPKITPCICEICKKYHEIFHNNDSRAN